MSVTRDGDGPRVGDRVRVMFEGTVAHLDDHDRVATVKTSDDRSARGQYVPLDASVEIVERAEDPHIGEIRSVAPSFDGKPKTAVKVGARLSDTPGERCLWVIVETGEVLKDGDVSGLGEVIGAAPGTPAAEAQKVGIGQTLPEGYGSWAEFHEKHPYKPRDSWAQYHADGIGLQQEMDALRAKRSVRVVNEPHGLPTSVRQAAADRLAAGDKDAAVRGLYHFGMTKDAALSYVEGMSEYQSYLSEHGEKREQRDARVFPSDGPEPPDDIECLLFIGVYRGKHGVHFLKRSVDLQRRWVWVTAPTADVTAMVGECNWPPPLARGSFTEVLS